MVKLCPIVESLTSMSGGFLADRGTAAWEQETHDGGVLRLKGCRPDTLTDFLRLIDVAIKELRDRASARRTAQETERQRSYCSSSKDGRRPGLPVIYPEEHAQTLDSDAESTASQAPSKLRAKRLGLLGARAWFAGDSKAK